jgi:hypothetical protein
MATNYPALIVAFAREDGLERLVTIGITAGVKKFYVAIDGPKNEFHRASQSRMHSYLERVREVEKVDVQIWQREENLGAATGVLTAINWFFKKEEAGFILEDDLIPSIDFFNYATFALDTYKNNPEVWLVAGSRMNPESKDLPISEWSYYPMIWGWATWAHKWDVMSIKLITINQPSLRTFFDRRVNFWWAGAVRARRGLVDAWDIPLAYAQFREKKLTVIPPVNFVTNVGFDSNATHTSGAVFPLNHPVGNLKSDLRFSSFINHQDAQNYDQVLEKTLFNIRFHHSFLRLYGPLLDFLKSRTVLRESLRTRLDRVKIPN